MTKIFCGDLGEDGSNRVKYWPYQCGCENETFFYGDLMGCIES